MLGSECSSRARQSTSVTVPSFVSKTVSRISVSSRYRRLVALISTAGEIRHRPPRSPSRMAEKIAGESKRGRHSQSIDPLAETRAAECVSAMNAYSSIRATLRENHKRTRRRTIHGAATGGRSERDGYRRREGAGAQERVQ